MEELFDLTDSMRDYFLSQTEKAQPEKELMFAVFAQAMDDLRDIRYRQSAIFWFNTRDEEGIYSFRGVCSTFDIKVPLDVMAASIIERIPLKKYSVKFYINRYYKSMIRKRKKAARKLMGVNNLLIRKALLVKTARRRLLKNRRKRVRAKMMKKIISARKKEIRMRQLVQPEHI